VLEGLCICGRTIVKLLVLELNGQCDLQMAGILMGAV